MIPTRVINRIFPMNDALILASGSTVRARLLRQAGISHEVVKPGIDETAVLASLRAQGFAGRDVADALADGKAAKVSARNPGRWVLGCDQVLEADGILLEKPLSREEAVAHLEQLQGSHHRLFSAAVLTEDGRPIWRHVGVAKLWVRQLSSTFISAYVEEFWDEIRHCVGCYRIEAEGARLFSRAEGDFFTILGMPLLEIQSYLALRGRIAT